MTIWLRAIFLPALSIVLITVCAPLAPYAGVYGGYSSAQPPQNAFSAADQAFFPAHDLFLSPGCTTESFSARPCSSGPSDLNRAVSKTIDQGGTMDRAGDLFCTAPCRNLQVASNPPQDGGDGGRATLTPWPANPRYWQYNNQPKLLLGGSDRDSMFQLSPSVLRSQLDTMVAAGGNYLRNTMSDRKANRTDTPVYAFKQVAGGKYDLNQWNDAYWNRLDTMLQETARRNVVMQVELWDTWDFIAIEAAENSLPTGNSRWYNHPWNPLNNINYSASDTTLPETWHTGMGKHGRETIHPIFKTIPSLNNDPVVLEFQRRFIEKVLSHTLQYDHVLYQIQNEHWGPMSWSTYWAEFIHKQAARHGKTIYVTESRHTPTVAPVRDYQRLVKFWHYPRLFNFADISQSAMKSGEAHMTLIRRSWQQTEGAPLPINSTKQYGADSLDWTGSANEGVDRFIRSVFGGQASVRFHRPPAGLGISTRAQKVIRSVRMMEKEIDFFNKVQPHSVSSIRSLLSNRSDNEAYIMADPGRAYAVYFPDGGSVTLDTSTASGSMTLGWIDVDNGTWGSTATVSGSSLRLSAPGGKWIAVITADR